jgi:very-short-patch-repair endonuclease
MHARWTQQREIARDMRHSPTPAEALLWQRLRNRGLNGAKFRRQHPIDRFILDFYCAEVGLAIELDGAVHNTRSEEDALRQEFLEERGIKFLRFTNPEVLRETDRVLSDIARVLEELRSRAARKTSHTSSPSPRRGEGVGG